MTKPNYMNTVPYQNVVRNVMYASVSSRPDIAHVANIVSQSSSYPGPQHWVAVKFFFKDLKRTLKHEITLCGNSEESPKLIIVMSSGQGTLITRDQLQCTTVLSLVKA